LNKPRRKSKDTEREIRNATKKTKNWVRDNNTDPNFRKKLKPQNTVCSAEQEAIIKAIYVTQRAGERRVIITDSLSTFKTLSLRKLLDEEREKVTFLWVPAHMGLPGMKSHKLPWKTTS
jgi:hypothetical protein